MQLAGFEVKKVVNTPVVWFALAAVIGLNIFSVLLGGYQSSEYAAGAPAFRTNIQKIQDWYLPFAGPITQEWIERYQQEADAVLHNPQYRVSDEEVEVIVQRQIERGYREEVVRENPVLFLNEIGAAEYDKYEGVQVASEFYTNALEFGDYMADYYRKTYPGEKGAVMAADTQARYHKLATEYTANYNYSYGYQKVRNMMTTYPYTVGVMILIALAPLFSAEYARKTDALLLSAKNGKGKLVCAKIKAGLLIALAVWGIITALNLLLIFTIYGTIGWEAFWQNWVIDMAPFPWTQGQITIISIFTSLLGALFFALVVMLVSVCSKRPFIAIVIGAVILLLPMLDLVFVSEYFVDMVYNFLPTRMMMGIRIWQGYDLLYFFGHTVPYQYAAVVFAVILSVCTCPLTMRFYTNHQVEN